MIITKYVFEFNKLEGLGVKGTPLPPNYGWNIVTKLSMYSITHFFFIEFYDIWESLTYDYGDKLIYRYFTVYKSF